MGEYPLTATISSAPFTGLYRPGRAFRPGRDNEEVCPIDLYGSTINGHPSPARNERIGRGAGGEGTGSYRSATDVPADSTDDHGAIGPPGIDSTYTGIDGDFFRIAATMSATNFRAYACRNFAHGSTS